MNILLLLSTNEITGAETNVRDTALNLDRSKFNPILVKTGTSRLQKFRKNGLKAYSVPKFDGRKLFTRSDDLIEIIQREKIDLIHAHDVNASIKAYILSKNSNRPTISHIHSAYSWMAQKKNMRRLIDKTYRNKYTLTIACSQHVRNYYTDKNPSAIKNKILTLNNAFDFSKVPKSFNEVLQEDCFKFLFVGRLSKVKRVDLLIKAFREVIKSHSNAKLFIVGDGFEKTPLMELSEQYNLTEHINFLGAKENVFDYYNRADCIVLPSDSEGLPLVILEAFSMKKVVIATNLKPYKKIITDGETGILTKRGDYKSMAEKMTHVIEHFDKVNDTITNNAYRLVKKDFAMKGYINKLQAIYESALEEK